MLGFLKRLFGGDSSSTQAASRPPQATPSASADSQSRPAEHESHAAAIDKKPAARVLVLYHSMYGHVERLAQEVAAGASEVSGAEVTIKRVPETMSEEAFTNAGGIWDQQAEVATPEELADYDAIIVGVGTRFGNMPGQMRTFLDQTGGLWAKGALRGKIASVFGSTGTGGGQEQTLTTTWTSLAHHGMVIVPIGYGAQELFDISSPRGGTPYGGTVLAGGDGSRQASESELAIVHYQGRYVTEITVKSLAS